MLVRDTVDKDYGRLFDLYGYGTTVWSPLSGGLLTGKYNDGIPADSRIRLFENLPFIKEAEKKLLGDALPAQLKKLGEIAKRLEISQA
jgi:aryl-alcohol dehydrogenase-like predicted oxidoreductase